MNILNFKIKFEKLLLEIIRKHSLFLAFCSGILSALAQAPLYLWPLMIIGYGLLFIMVNTNYVKETKKIENKKTLKHNFILGYFFGLGFFITGMYWLAFPFFADPSYPSYLFFLGVPGLPIFLALFFAFSMLLFTFLKSKKNYLANYFLFIICIMATEDTRAFILTGFPWNLPGHIIGFSTPLMQIVGVIGVQANGFLVLAYILIPSLMVFYFQTKRELYLGTILLLLVPVVILVFGYIRIDKYNKSKSATGINVHIIQPNTTIADKIDTQKWLPIIQKQLNLSKVKKITAGPSVVIWPENAVPYLREFPEHIESFSKFMPKDTVFFTGTVRSLFDDKTGEELFYNSLETLYLNQTENISNPYGQIYNKTKLVPFGEYMPLVGVLKSLNISAFNGLSNGFSKGSGAKVISTGVISVIPIICYEVIFSNFIKTAYQNHLNKFGKNAKIDAILLITNDGWFDRFFAPAQLLDQARFRAIEFGLPVLRSGATGISAIIDPVGNIKQSIAIGQEGTITDELPDVYPELTNYFLLGKYSHVLLYSIFILLYLVVIRGNINLSMKFENI